MIVDHSSKALFKQLIVIIPNLRKIKESGKSKSGGFMDLNLDILQSSKDIKRIALSHYYKHDCGDMIADPDMEFMVNLEDEWVEPLTFQDYRVYQEVYSEGMDRADMRLRASLHEFAKMWFMNLKYQGHLISRY